MIDYTELAKQAMEMPADFAWFGDDEMFVTHGYSGISRHRDSGNIDNSNYAAIWKYLEEKYDEELFDDVGSSHWAVGWVDQITVRILKDGTKWEKYGDTWFVRGDEDREIEEDDITDIFKDIVEIALDLRESYPIFDEELYSEYEYADTLKNIESERPGWLCAEPEDIYSALYDMDMSQGSDDDHGEWFQKEDIIKAAFIGGLIDDESDWDDLFDYLEGTDEMKEFVIWCKEMKRHEFEINQGVLL